MRNKIILLLFIIAVLKLKAQPNCEAFKYYGQDLKYKACKVAEKRRGHHQASRKYQEVLDKSLEIDSTFAFAYKAKSTAYLKSGDFITWKKLMDKAVEYNTKEYLDYRGWCRYQFFRDYEGAIKDIELLDSLVTHDIGYSVNGDYHLQVAKALCYKGIGNIKKAISIIEAKLSNKDGFVDLYDYLHLGVMYYEEKNYQKSIKALKRQEHENDIAENRFYIALAYKAIGQIDKYKENLKVAKNKYINDRKLFDPYVAQMDKICLEDIENELKNLNG